MKEASLPYQHDRRRSVSPNWSHWYLSILKMAVGLLLILLIALLWLLRQNEIDEQRSTLIADVLWLEQSVRFQLEGQLEQLRQLALDLNRTDDQNALFALRAGHILEHSPELQKLLWLDASARPVRGIPTPILPRSGEDMSGDVHLKRAIELVRLGNPVYSEAYRTPEQAQFEIYVPIFDGGEYRGTLLGVYSLDGLLKQQVPWWFAEKYQVRVLDNSGDSLASKSKIDAASTTLSYPVSFDPPGYGMVLQVTAYRGADNLAQTLIAALIIILAAAVFWSLWAVRGLIQRRLFAEQALRSEYAFRKAMEDSLTVGMRARDLNGRVTYVNPAFLEMVGFDADELIGREPPMPYWAPEEMERTLLLHQSVLEGKPPLEGFEIRLMRKDGSRFDALVYEAPLIEVDGTQTGWMASIIDVTARKHAEELAQQQQEKLQVTSRLVTMGEMASTLAHELNQPLAAITSYNAGCLNKLESGDFTTAQLKEALGKLAVQAQRAGLIIRRVHDFVRKSEPKRAPCDLAEVVDDSIGFIEGAAKARGVRIVREIQGMRPELMADQVMLEQVLLNLMRNGIEAMRHTPAELRRLTIKLSQLDNHQMEIRVIDHGPGIPPEVEEKLFTPLFSTKAEGMGMGLNICRSIIEFHHGRLWVEANPEGGSIFVITLPIGLQ
ncbi:PAS domain S-box protein [Accumulibacter sp.]|uniref:sensor histidine kinase n=1 Tax=Accumulibacter sp. TaxID=2053492 RepID=UPI0028C4D65A|nr:PAS domain S-box protein [Accumulibacter sp.]